MKAPLLFRYPEVPRRRRGTMETVMVCIRYRLQCKLCVGVEIPTRDEFAVREHGHFHTMRGEATGRPGGTLFRLTPLGEDFVAQREAQGDFRHAPVDPGLCPEVDADDENDEDENDPDDF